MYIEIWILIELFPSQRLLEESSKAWGWMQVAWEAMNSDLIDCTLSGFQTGNGESGVSRGTGG